LLILVLPAESRTLRLNSVMSAIPGNSTSSSAWISGRRHSCSGTRARLAERSRHEADDHERGAVLAGQPDVALGGPDVDYDRSTLGRRRVRSRANSTSALASSRMALAAASPYAAGRTTVALTGQRIRTTCGVSWPSTSSTTRWSFWVMHPCEGDSGGRLFHGQLLSGRGLGERYRREPRPLLVVTSGASLALVGHTCQ
jgi:hypothetical protein